MNNPALSVLRQAFLEDREVQEAIALARAEPDNASSKRVLELVRAAEKVLALAEGGNHVHSGPSAPPVEGEG